MSSSKNGAVADLARRHDRTRIVDHQRQAPVHRQRAQGDDEHRQAQADGEHTVEQAEHARRRCRDAPARNGSTPLRIARAQTTAEKLNIQPIERSISRMARRKTIPSDRMPTKALLAVRLSSVSGSTNAGLIAPMTPTSRPRATMTPSSSGSRRRRRVAEARGSRRSVASLTWARRAAGRFPRRARRAATPRPPHPPSSPATIHTGGVARTRCCELTRSITMDRNRFQHGLWHPLAACQLPFALRSDDLGVSHGRRCAALPPSAADR